MSAPPKLRTVRADQTKGGGEMPDWAMAAFSAINQTVRELCSSLSKGLTRADNLAGGSKAALFITTPASGSPIIRVRCGAGSPPGHFVVSKLERDDAATITDVWSITWRNLSGTEVEVTFQGLAASTKYKFSCLYE